MGILREGRPGPGLGHWPDKRRRRVKTKKEEEVEKGEEEFRALGI